MGPYALVLCEDAMAAFARASRREQRNLALVLDALKAAPFRRVGRYERGADGRVNHLLRAGAWLLTYWLDHATREIRIVDLEHVRN